MTPPARTNGFASLLRLMLRTSVASRTSTALRTCFLLMLTCAWWAVAAEGADGAMVTFASTGTEQTFTVPVDVSTLHVVAIGGRGGPAYLAGSAPYGMGGFGSVATADLPVTAGEVLYIEV